jgi:hypothetical protein
MLRAEQRRDLDFTDCVWNILKGTCLSEE